MRASSSLIVIDLRKLFLGLGLLVVCAILLSASPARAQQQTSTCLAIAENKVPQFGPRIVNAAFTPVQARDNETVTITYVGHSTFRIESPNGVTIATDFNGFAGPNVTPDIVTMNHAHSTHYTDTPDPAISHVLRGWPQGGAERAEHYLTVDDVYVRNVSTDIYRGGALVQQNGNSIFIFEIAGLCIGHLGHLHHTLTPEKYAEIGRLDVLMIPVDGTYTMSQDSMADIAKRLRASIILPMHYFSRFSLDRYMAAMADSFATEVTSNRSFTVSLRTLPDAPIVKGILLY